MTGKFFVLASKWNMSVLTDKTIYEQKFLKSNRTHSVFNSVATYPRACPDSSLFQSPLAHLAVGMTLLKPSLFEQVDSTFSVLYVGHSAAFLIYNGVLAECTRSNFKKG